MNTPNPFEKAVSLDEYISSQRESIERSDLLGLRKLIPALQEKSLLAQASGYPDLIKGVEVLTDLLLSEEVEASGDPLPTHLAEAGVAARYLLKGIDLIPDSLPKIGLADDAWVVARVFQRNPELLKAK